MSQTIDYGQISRAIGFYHRQGFQYIDTPWLVSQEAINITLPPGTESYKIDDKHLVGSAEQGFLQMMLDGTIENTGRYSSAGPCFRSDKLDALHQRYFFKLELISINKDETQELLSFAEEYFNSYLGANFANKCSVVKTEQGFDLEFRGIEIGSYGYRKYKDFSWTYGTGLALPRFDYVRYN